jgi:small subunit ribosomal protein S8
MSMNDSLANALSSIMNDEKVGKNKSQVGPGSKIIKKVLDVMQKSRYIGDFEEIENGNLIKINLLGKINKCGVVKPRYSVRQDQFEKFEKRYLLARDMGILIISTPFGIMSHINAKEKKTGGKILAYCY